MTARARGRRSHPRSCRRPSRDGRGESRPRASRGEGRSRRPPATPLAGRAAGQAAASARAIGWREVRASVAAASRSAAATPSGTRRRRPSVSVPVLSKTTVSAAANRSRAVADFSRMPCRISRALASTWTTGTARPRAQGQVMIRTATAIISAGCQAMPPKQGPAEEGGQRQAVHDRGVGPRDAVGQGHEAAAALLGHLHQADDLGQQRALADRRTPHAQRCREVDACRRRRGRRAPRAAAASRR